MATQRLRLKNLRASYLMRLPTNPDNADLARMVRLLYDTVRTELSTLIDTAADTGGSGEHGEDVPIEAVRQLSLELSWKGMRATGGSIPDDGKHPAAVVAVRLA